jgi:hypothetical protein
LSNIESLLIKEYEITTELVKSRERLVWQIGAVLLPTTAASVGLAINFTSEMSALFMIAMSFAGTWVSWFLRMRQYNNACYVRLREIENVLGFRTHHAIHDFTEGPKFLGKDLGGNLGPISALWFCVFQVLSWLFLFIKR